MELQKYIASSKRYWPLVIVIPLTALAACSSSENAATPSSVSGLTIGSLDGKTADQTTSPWLAVVQLFRIQSPSRALGVGDGDTRISTFEYSGDRTFQQHIAWYQPKIELDTCDVNNIENVGGTLDNPLSISAGQEVFINSPSGTIYSVSAQNSGVYR
jgi:hypothetical protein